jgi:hypothetical protein
MMTALVAGSVDVLICFHNAQQPIQLDPEHYDRAVLRREMLRPYASPRLVEEDVVTFPGRADRPIPLLMYSPGVYFGRLVELVLEAAPARIHARRVIESDMSDVLRDWPWPGTASLGCPSAPSRQARVQV